MRFCYMKKSIKTSNKQRRRWLDVTHRNRSPDNVGDSGCDLHIQDRSCLPLFFLNLVDVVKQTGRTKQKPSVGKRLPTFPKLPFPNTLMKLNSSRPKRFVWALSSPFSPFSPGVFSWLSVEVVPAPLCSSPRLSNDNAFLMLFSSSLISVKRFRQQ